MTNMMELEHEMAMLTKKLSGELGAFWKKDAESESVRLVELFNTNSIIEADGAAKWASNGMYLPHNVLAHLLVAGVAVNAEATLAKREAQGREFLEAYRKTEGALSEEARYEMRAAFGPGATVVNVFTGRKTTL